MMTNKQRLHATGLSRRAVIGGLLSSTAIALHPAFGRPVVQRLPSLPTPTGKQEPFQNPQNLVAAPDGTFTLDLEERDALLGPQQNGLPGQQKVRVQAYVDPNNPVDQGSEAALNRPICGPTLTLRGDGVPQDVTIKLRNNLPVLPAHQHHNIETPHGFNVTNLHTHGLHVAPDQDNVYVVLCPKGSVDCNAESMRPPGAKNVCQPAVVAAGEYTYKYSVGKTPTGTTKLPAGTYWYHPHKHGSVALQVGNGLAGAIIVKGDMDEIPGVKGLTEQVLVAQMIPYYVKEPGATGVVVPDYLYGLKTPPTPTNLQISLSGMVNPVISMQAGEIQRWRFINATDCFFFYLEIVSVDGSTAPTLYAIATDGIPLTNVPGTMDVPYQLGSPVANPASQADAILNEVAGIAPAQRLDLLVRMPPQTDLTTPRRYEVHARPFPAGTGETGQIIATIEVKGSKATPDVMPATSAFNAGALYRPPINLPTNLNNLSQLNPTPTQSIDFSFQPTAANNSTVNLTTFDPLKPQLNLGLGNVDIWGLQGYQGPHAFHIHINSFVMYQRDAYTFAPAVIWRDTALIGNTTNTTSPTGPAAGPPGTPWPTANTYFISQQLDYSGEYVLHCHVLMHEDTGMMWSVAIGCENAEKTKKKGKKKS